MLCIVPVELFGNECTSGPYGLPISVAIKIPGQSGCLQLLVLFEKRSKQFSDELAVIFKNMRRSRGGSEERDVGSTWS